MMVCIGSETELQSVFQLVDLQRRCKGGGIREVQTEFESINIY